MTLKLRKILVLCAAMVMTASCGTVEEFVLLNDLDVNSYYKMQPIHELHIKRGDDLRIVVTHKLPKLTEMFNKKLNSLDDGESYVTYTVNEEGYVNFPYLDTIKAEGLTCAELERELSRRIEEAGYAVGANVNVRVTNFKVTVIGETGTGVYTFDNQNPTIFDLVAKAGLAGGNNSSFQGGTGIRRDKILVMREVNGILNSDYISLLTKDIFFSPYYYLQQNDIIYVWPSQTTIRSSNRLFDYWWGRLSVVTTAVSAITLLVTLFSKKN